jgi:hypothetical protein
MTDLLHDALNGAYYEGGVFFWNEEMEWEPLNAAEMEVIHRYERLDALYADVLPRAPYLAWCGEPVF